MFELSDLKNIIIDFFKKVFGSRIIVCSILFCIMSAVLLQRAFVLQIVRGQDYVDKYELQIQKTKKIEGTRGNIYDRNGVLLAYNELAYAVTIEDNGEYDDQELNDIITKVIKIVQENGDIVISDFGVILDGTTYRFASENDTQRLRFIADVYGEKYTDALTPQQKNISAEGIVNYLCTDKLYGYGIDQKKLSKKEVLQLVNVRYALALNSFQKFIATTISEGVSQETVANIMENLDELPGVSIEEKSLRKYVDSKMFANIIGYTGQISAEEYDALDKKVKKEYELTDTVGKAGIEKEMDTTLRGDKGELKMYVNIVGKVIDTLDEKKAVAGDNVYLTIDSRLQKAAYNIIEQELAGIVMSKLTDTLDYDRTQIEDNKNLTIPVGDLYDNLISNEIIDMNHFGEEGAGTTEIAIKKAFDKRKSEVLSQILETLTDPDGEAYNNLSKEMQAYQYYITAQMLSGDTGIIQSEKIDAGDNVYKAWVHDESININEYLNHLIAQDWIDTSQLQEFTSGSGNYTDSEEIYNALIAYISDLLQTNKAFDKIIYKYLIRSGTVSGQQLCMILYEQGVLKYDEDQYNRLANGSLAAYDFVRGKIQTLDLTPGQLGLEPCTASFVMTDSKTGEVLACVSYPGYDNNRLANTMDSNYFSKLVSDKARPFYNNATQEKTAPGSTYKPLVAVAALTEGVIDTQTYLPCQGVYKKVEPNPKCWAYPNAHGSLEIIGAIENSCNCFFYETGYRMSLKDNGLSLSSRDNEKGEVTAAYYSSTLGTDTIGKYAKEFGLGETSGLEILEEKPQISDESSVPTAIGQGNNNYTTSQLARYVTTVATKGTRYELSLLNKVTDSDNKTIKDFDAKSEKVLNNVSDVTWNSVHAGMRNVVAGAHSSSFRRLNDTDIELSGKTGTAEQSQVNANHALFIGFAPSSDPEVAFSIRIANGYSSTYTCEIAESIMLYYYNLTPEEELITGEAWQSGGDVSNEG